jgi:hypothetical protein
MLPRRPPGYAPAEPNSLNIKVPGRGPKQTAEVGQDKLPNSEEGVSLRDIAEAIGKGVKVPVVSIPAEKAEVHFGMFAHFATLDMPASSEWTRETLGWNPTGPGMIEDLANMKFI